MRRRTIYSVLIALLLALLVAPALAHDGPSRLELGAPAISPGAALEVRGVNIAEEAPVTVALIGPSGSIDLGAVFGDEHGDFVQAFALPADLAAGDYTVRAFGSNRVIVTAPLAIVGAAAPEEGGQRDEDEPLLAALPRLQIPTAAPAAAPAAQADPLPSAATSAWPVLAIVAALLGALGVAVVRRRGVAGVR